MSVFLSVGLVEFACFVRRSRAGFADRRSGEGNAAGGAADRERIGASAYDTVRPSQHHAGIASKPDTF